MKTLVEVLERRSESQGSDIFCFFYQQQTCQEISIRTLLAESMAYANLYRRSGISSGSNIFIILNHCPDLFYAFVGSLLCGCRPSFLPFPSPKQDPVLYWASHRALFARMGESAVVTYSENEDALREHIHDLPVQLLSLSGVAGQAKRFDNAHPALDDLAFLQHSSGTTGLKKGVALSYRSVAEQVESYAKAIQLTASDRIASWLPLYHDMGLITSFILPLMRGIPVAYMDAFEWAAKPASLFRLMEQHQCTFTWLPNFAFQHLSNTVDRQTRFDLSCMKAFIDCSEPCKPETFDRFLDAFAPFGVRRDMLQTCYAMAETVFAVTQTHIGEPVGEVAADVGEIVTHQRVVDAAPESAPGRYLSVGKPIQGLEISIMGSNGQPLTEGSIGEVAIRGKCLFSGYYNLPEETSKKLHDGWYFSGDLGFLRNGELFITGRSNDLIIVRGKNFYAHDLELCANSVEGVKPGRAVAIDWYNPAVGTEDVVMVAETELTDRQAQKACQIGVKKNIFDRFGLLVRKVELVPPGWLVKTTSGKISRVENKKKYAAEREG